MAVQIEAQGQLQEFIGILKRRKWQVILPAAVIIALGTAVAVIVPKKFVARTTIELRQVGVSISTKEAVNAPFQIKSSNRVRKVVKDLQNSEYLGLSPEEQNEFVDNAVADIKVGLVAGTTQNVTFVNISYADVNAKWAEEFLKGLTQDWIDDVIKLDIRKAEDEQQTLLIEKQKLTKALQHEENLLMELRRQHGLSATQPVPGSEAARGEDPVFARLKANEAERDRLNRELSTLGARIEAQQKRYNEMPPRMPQSSVIAGVSNATELNAIELEISQIKEELHGLKPPNSTYQKLKQKLIAKENQRDQLRRLVTKGDIQESSVENSELAPLRKLIDDLKIDRAAMNASLAKLGTDIEADYATVAELQPVYSEVRVRSETIARLSLTLAQTEARYTEKVQQALLVAGPLADPFKISDPVRVGNKATEPNPLLIVSFAIVAGIGIGLATAILLEYSKNCFRSVGDISRVMFVPVLGAINTITTRRERRVRQARRLVVGLSSLVFIGAVLFVTWAWANNAQLLSQDVRDAIEQLRSKLR